MADRQRAIEEQRHGLVLAQRRNTYDPLTFESQRFSTCRQDVQVRASRQQNVSHVGARVEEVLAVVEHEECAPAGEVHGQGVGIGTNELESQCRSDALPDQRRIHDRCEVNEEHSLGELTEEACPYLQCEAGFAAPAHAGQGDEAAVAHRPYVAVDVSGSADKRRPLQREVVAPDLQGAERRKHRYQSRRQDLVDVLFPVEVSETVLTEVFESGIGGKGVQAD
jgi:hypothetical protein